MDRLKIPFLNYFYSRKKFYVFGRSGFSDYPKIFRKKSFRDFLWGFFIPEISRGGFGMGFFEDFLDIYIPGDRGFSKIWGILPRGFGIFIPGIWNFPFPGCFGDVDFFFVG